jgi:hypothetical protein
MSAFKNITSLSKGVAEGFASASNATPDGIGFEKVISVVGDGINKTRFKLVDIFEGKPVPSGSKPSINPLDIGLIPITKELASIDLCNVLTYLINKTPKFKPFVPSGAYGKSGQNDKPEVANTQDVKTSPIERSLQFLQEKAYQIQIVIDEYYAAYGSSTNPETRIALFSLLQDLNSLMGEGQNGIQDLAKDPQLVKVFPQLTIFSNFIGNSTGYFSRYSNLATLPVPIIQKILSYIDKIRSICVAIQGLNSLAAIVQFADGVTGGKIGQEIAKLNKIVRPDKLMPLIKSVQKTCLSIQNICRLVIGYIGKAQQVIQIATLILKVIRIVKVFLLLLPIPNLFTTLGISNLISDITQDKLVKLITQLIKRLSQINQILNSVIALINYVISQIDVILEYIKVILLNLESCENADPAIVNELKDTVKDLENSRKFLDDFRKNYLNKKDKKNATFGDRVNKYSIEVLTEELTDEGIDLKRRYGIALDKNGVKVVESTPTFASDTNIIINEVKVKLVSEGFVKSGLSGLSAIELSTIDESLSYLQGDDINFDPFEDSFNITELEDTGDKFGLDNPSNENDDQDNLGLNSFINKISGGKKLRRKMRKMMVKQLSKTSSELKSADSSGKYSSKYSKSAEDQQKAQQNKLDSGADLSDRDKRKIKNLELEKSALVKALSGKISSTVQKNTKLLTGGLVAKWKKRIEEIDKEIKKIKEGG